MSGGGGTLLGNCGLSNGMLGAFLIELRLMGGGGGVALSIERLFLCGGGGGVADDDDPLWSTGGGGMLDTDTGAVAPLKCEDGG